VTSASPKDPYAALKIPEVRALLFAVALSTLASSSLAVVIGYQVYRIARDPLALGTLGLVEAIPALSLALFGGYVADRFERRGIVVITSSVMVLASVLFALVSGGGDTSSLLPLYAVVFVVGIARGFSGPALGALEAQVVPVQLTMTASSWMSAAWVGCAIVGPALGGFAFDGLGAAGTFWMIAGIYGAAWIFVLLGIKPKPKPVPPQGERLVESIAVGVRFVFQNQIIVGSMALDLFAVLFGGAIALLPIFANDILNVGAKGLGFLIAAPSVGALAVMLLTAHRPPMQNAGRNLMLCVAGFGVTMIVFALSRNFYLTLFALMLSGVFDGVSMVIRRSIIRLNSPEHMRGRIAAVSGIFIGASNELGALESGVAAKLLGTTRSVWLGGVVTLIVVGATALLAPKLRGLHLQPRAKDAAPLEELAATD
jgi:MFS family permease